MAIVAFIAKYIVTPLFVIYLTWLKYRLDYIDNDGRTSRHKRTRKIVLGLVIVLCFLGIVSVGIDDYRKAGQKAESDKTITNLNGILTDIRKHQASLPNEVSRGVNELLIMATNSKLSDSALAVAIREREVIAQAPIPINTDKPDFQALVSNYQSRLELKRYKDEQGRRDAERIAQEEAQRAAKLAEQQESFVSEKTYPVFEYALRTLHALLTDRARQNGGQLSTTYKGLPRAIGSAVNTVCRIDAGEKSPWVFYASLTQSPRTLVIKCADFDWGHTNKLANGRYYRSRQLDWQLDGAGLRYLITMTISLEGQDLGTVAASMLVRTKPPQEFPTFEAKEPYTNYVKCVDTALGTLMGAQPVVVEHAKK